MNQQKSGTACCCSATQGSGIALHPNKQQESTPMYIPLRVYARTLNIYTLMDISAAMFWMIMNLPDSE